jgi:hypothetical protein
MAHGSGTASHNDCTPSCAAGRRHDYRATVLVTGSEQCPSGRVSYRTVTVRPLPPGYQVVRFAFPCHDSAVAKNLTATPAVKAALRSAFLAAQKPPKRIGVEGPLPGKTYYDSYGVTRYAVATFSVPTFGTQDQPELFKQLPGEAWIDEGDTGGCISSSIIPVPLLTLWGFKPSGSPSQGCYVP